MTDDSSLRPWSKSDTSQLMGRSGLACFSIRSSEQEIIVVILVVINISLVSTVSSHLENIELYGKCTEILNLGISNFELIMAFANCQS